MKIDFEEAAKEVPLSREELAKRIAETPLNIRQEYVFGLQMSVKRFNEKCNLLLSGPSLCEHLLHEMDDDEAENIEAIVDLLNDEDVLKKIDCLIEASCSNKASRSEENRKEKKKLVNEVVETIETMEESNRESITDYSYYLYISYVRVLRMLLFYRNKNKSVLALKRYLGALNEKTLEDIAQTTLMLKKLAENNS